MGSGPLAARGPHGLNDVQGCELWGRELMWEARGEGWVGGGGGGGSISKNRP